MVDSKKKMLIGQIVVNAYFVFVSLLFLTPLILMITSSFMTDAEIRSHGYRLFPQIWSLEAYRYVFRVPERIVSAYRVTILTSVVGTFVSVIVMGLVAYPLSRRDFAYRGVITWFIFLTMIFSGGLIPSFIVNTQVLGLQNSFWIYILLHLCSAFFIIIMRTFFQQLPVELVESAKIDGAGEFRIFFTIIAPLSKPVFATIALFVLLQRWNEWMITLIYITDDNLFTLQFILQRILGEAEFIRTFMVNFPGAAHMIDARAVPTLSMRYAMTVLAAGPMLVIFPFFQKYFTKGLTVGAVKG
ncbi:MAG: carbohydrate ABC transporter permease [Defluviitaleaceae bacterium]|nr:carbohydrate ABC transporter permease [Defluviitaleaceae bacterium]